MKGLEELGRARCDICCCFFVYQIYSLSFFFYYRCKAEGKREGLFAKISKSILKEIGFFPNLVVERMAGCEGREIAG